MIREIINFTEDLIADIPDIMQWKARPSKGLHVFVDIGKDGNWLNQELEKGKDYDYYDGKNSDIPMWKECIDYQEVSDYITMNKVQKFDVKQKIHSCSPFCVAFNFCFNKDDKKELGIKELKKGSGSTKEEKIQIEQDIREKRITVIKKRLNDYLRCSCSVFFSNIMGQVETDEVNVLKDSAGIFIKLVSENMLDEIKKLDEFQLLTKKDYVRIYLRSLDIKIQRKYYQLYLKQEILNGENLTNNKNYGALGFMTTFTTNKTFMRHKTSMQINGVSCRYSTEDALIINNFEKLLKRNVFPNPLPIIIDKREINTQVVKIFNENTEPLSYMELMRRLFEKNRIKDIPDYYLLFYTKTKDGIIFNDFDFVPLFRYEFEPKVKIENITEIGLKKDSVFEKDKDIIINNIFDFERIVVREIFNNSLVRIKDEKYRVNYFGDIDPKYVIGGDMVFQLILKYRKAFYDYIYKSKINAINSIVFDDIMYVSILSNIKEDEIKGRFDCNYTVKRKINIWFSLYKLFNNNKSIEIMASKVTDMMSKMRSVVKGESILEMPEEFAFGAGQIVSYLIDRSAASDKTYALLEPYLQKTKSNLLQDAIAQTISVYKHNISTYKGPFQALASNVLTYDDNIEVKPLLKFFLAGCFCPCVVYDTNNKK